MLQPVFIHTRPGRQGRLGGFILLGVLLLAAACTKVAPVHTIVPVNINTDTARDIRKILDSVPDFSLFAQAVQRGQADTLLTPANLYTLFIPTDSAMMAAGLTAQVIQAMPVDSLSKWVQYYMTRAAVTDAELTGTPVSVQLYGIRQDESLGSNGAYNVYQYSLYVKEDGVLYINGLPVNTGEPAVQASNGYLYPIHTVLPIPSQTVFGIIGSRPELSMYLFALRLMDSVYEAYNISAGTNIADTIIFSQLAYVQSSYPITSQPIVQATVLAPTNTAFQNAGFSSTADIRAYVLNTPPSSVFNYSTYTSVVNYIALDSVLKAHYVYNPNQSVSNPGEISTPASYTNLLCYNDLAGFPGINNGVLNVNAAVNGMVPFPLQFSSVSGVLNVRWNASGPPAVIPNGSSRNLIGLNGVIIESDQLFYPHN